MQEEGSTAALKLSLMTSQGMDLTTVTEEGSKIIPEVDSATDHEAVSIKLQERVLITVKEMNFPGRLLNLIFPKALEVEEMWPFLEAMAHGEEETLRQRGEDFLFPEMKALTSNIQVQISIIHFQEKQRNSEVVKRLSKAAAGYRDSVLLLTSLTLLF